MQSPSDNSKVDEKTGKRWLVYALIGFIFGIADWYYLELLAHFPWGNIGNNPIVIPIIIILNYGVWLVPILPITLYESRRTGSWYRPALAGSFCWVISIISYYLFYTLLLAFWGLPNMQHLLVLGEKPVGFWQEWSAVFQRVILNQVLEWIPIALIGGFLAGFLMWKISSSLYPTRKPANYVP